MEDLAREPERLDPTEELERLNKEADSWLPKFLVDEQERLSKMGVMALGEQLAYMVISMALRKTGSTPRGVLNDLIESASTDETWREKVGPELRRVLTARGVDLGE